MAGIEQLVWFYPLTVGGWRSAQPLPNPHDVNLSLPDKGISAVATKSNTITLKVGDGVAVISPLKGRIEEKPVLLGDGRRSVTIVTKLADGTQVFNILSGLKLDTDPSSKFLDQNMDIRRGQLLGTARAPFVWNVWIRNPNVATDNGNYINPFSLTEMMGGIFFQDTDPNVPLSLTPPPR